MVVVALVAVKFAKIAVPVNVGDAEKTAKPVPVSSVSALARFADDGVPKKVAIPAASPETPVEIGSPVPLVRVTALGVPRLGVVNAGELASTIAPVPVTAFERVTPP